MEMSPEEHAKQEPIVRSIVENCIERMQAKPDADEDEWADAMRECVKEYNDLEDEYEAVITETHTDAPDAKAGGCFVLQKRARN